MSLTAGNVPASADSTPKKLTPKQLQAVKLRAMGKSVNDVCVEIGIVQQTYYRWKKLPPFQVALEEMKQQWIDDYENTFGRMLPLVALRHQQLVNSQSEAIAMRAVDSAHANHVRCVKEAETKTEVQELRELVLALTEQLSQQRANG